MKRLQKVKSILLAVIIGLGSLGYASTVSAQYPYWNNNYGYNNYYPYDYNCNYTNYYYGNQCYNYSNYYGAFPFGLLFGLASFSYNYGYPYYNNSYYPYHNNHYYNNYYYNKGYYNRGYYNTRYYNNGHYYSKGYYNKGYYRLLIDMVIRQTTNTMGDKILWVLLM